MQLNLNDKSDRFKCELSYNYDILNISNNFLVIKYFERTRLLYIITIDLDLALLGLMHSVHYISALNKTNNDTVYCKLYKDYGIPDRFWNFSCSSIFLAFFPFVHLVLIHVISVSVKRGLRVFWIWF